MNLKYIGIGVVWLVVIVGIFSVITRNDPSSQEPTTNTASTQKTMDTAQLIIKDEVVGTGEVAKKGDVVTVHYVGTLTNGTMFDASRKHGDKGFTFTLGVGQVIKGWDMGVEGMKVGGKRHLTIPSELAYGNQSVAGGLIPANSTLIFEVELLKVGK